MSDDLRDELRAVAREVVGDVAWPRLVAAGWPGLEVPEELGGAGVSFAESAVVLEELGRAAAPSRYLGTVLAVGALSLLPADAARDALLERIAGGARAALAMGFTYSDGIVSGQATFVPDAVDADILLLLADDLGMPMIVTCSGLTVAPQAVLDETRALATVTADRLETTHCWELPLDVDPERLEERAAVAVACDSLGVAEAMLAATVDYVTVRRQFDRPIGSFQAVKHACADMLVAISLARQLVDDAVALVASQQDASVAAAMAKSYTCGMAVDVAGKAMQLHGGIGYTWESGVHAYLKRAALNRSLYGSPAEYRRPLADRYTRTLIDDAMATCIGVATYGEALTYGKAYRVLQHDVAKHDVEVRGDDDRVRWFPESCFDLTGQPAVTLVDTWSEDEIDAPEGATHGVEVVFEFSDGQRRWCWFTTPGQLAELEQERFGDERLVMFGVPHMIVVSAITQDVIDRTIAHLEQQGRLVSCTRLCDD